MSAHDELSTFRVAIEYATCGRTRLELEGELDIASLARLRRLFYAVLEDCSSVAVDLAPLRFLDLPGVRLLVELAAVAAGRDCPLEIRGACGQVARVLDLTRVRTLLPLAA